ncbi:MAG: hypothetical protein K2M55_05680 [Muribaculaceae bacterium]|nr:hypothetical protein [Muribaculaceae bacterium]
MKTTMIKVICRMAVLAVAVLAPVVVSAQTNVRKAFDELLKSSAVELTESHSMEKDVTTGIKESQCDVYKFTLPASKQSLVDNIIKAFKSDEDKAYSVSSGLTDKNGIPIQIAVGDGKGSGVHVNPAGYNYYYALFQAPTQEDSKGKYRYCYAINWKKSKDKIEGTLFVTYATTLKYRQSLSQARQLTYLPGYETSDSLDGWFNKMVTYTQTLAVSTPHSRPVVAAKIYKLAAKTQTDTSISVADRNAARELLKIHADNSDNRYDKQTVTLLEQAISIIK